jgi:hypothetical protein
MRANNNLVSMVAIISLTLAMVGSPSIASGLSKDPIPIKDIEQNLETAESNNSAASDSESTTSFAKKGNSQNSPVPPECPKQGPIPPNCTMKPKF